MSHGTEHHLEHAEHAQHHANDPFDRRVAVTMAIMAAVLAGVTLASHRGHTETLQLATEAGSKHTQASDAWNFYQAKNIRSYEFQSFLLLQGMLDKNIVKQDDETKAGRDFWIRQVEKYEGQGYWAAFQESLKNPKEKRPESSGELASLRKNAEALQAEAKLLEEHSHHLHQHVTWIDLGHLGLELALVFCAVALLRKRAPFWLLGLGLGLFGAVLAGYGVWGWLALEAANAGAGHH